MKKILFILFILITSINSKAQNNDSIINTFLGKWIWWRTEGGQGGWTYPSDVGYTRTIYLYQDVQDIHTNSLIYITYENDTIISTARTYIDNIGCASYASWGNIYADIVLFDTMDYNDCGYCTLVDYNDTSYRLCIKLECFSDYEIFHYKKDTSYHFNYNNIPINIYPNPASNYITIICPFEATAEIRNIHSQLISTFTITDIKTFYNVAYLTKGLYFLKLKTDRGVAVKKFIKE